MVASTVSLIRTFSSMERQILKNNFIENSPGLY
jgi:hypothetical protein